MTKKTQAKTPPRQKPAKTPEEIAQAFMQLWQEKWNDTLREKGWPDSAPTPGLGQMPFFNPFMPMNGFTAAATTENDTIQKLEARVAALEKRLAVAPAKKSAAVKKKTR